jgi:hypothetical protein
MKATVQSSVLELCGEICTRVRIQLGRFHSTTDHSFIFLGLDVFLADLIGLFVILFLVVVPIWIALAEKVMIDGLRRR